MKTRSFPTRTSASPMHKFPARRLPIHRISTPNAFSLVELIVVMVIIGLLSSLVAVQTRSYLIASKQNAARAEISRIVSALDLFYADQSRYPTNEEGLVVLTQGTENFADGFLKKLTADPWGNPYEYFNPGSESKYEIVSLGGDGREGGEGGDKDISSENLDAAR